MCTFINEASAVEEDLDFSDCENRPVDPVSSVGAIVSPFLNDSDAWFVQLQQVRTPFSSDLL